MPLLGRVCEMELASYTGPGLKSGRMGVRMNDETI